MTTAHRPTFDPAQGKESTRGPAYHQRLLPAHTHLKLRQRGQGGVGGLSTTDTPSTSRQGLQQELLTAEASIHSQSNDTSSTKRKSLDDTAGGNVEDEEAAAKRRKLIIEQARAEDADTDSDDAAEKSSSESSSSEDESDDDDEAALRRELDKIKAERAAAREKEEAAKAAKAQEEREEEIARGNPLLNGDDSGGGMRDFGVKRRWDDDVVFKNQARGTEQRNKMQGREFVNDMLRSDFHKRFMSKYVR